MLLSQIALDPTEQPLQATYRILVLCTGNSARSIMAEALLNMLGQPYISAFSAGSYPTGRVNPYALEQIEQLNFAQPPVFTSKSWDVFACAEAAPIDIVLTVCGNAANECCPVLAGQPICVHWDMPDPAKHTESAAARQAFSAVFNVFKRRIESLMQKLQDQHSRDEVAALLQSLAK